MNVPQTKARHVIDLLETQARRDVKIKKRRRHRLICSTKRKHSVIEMFKNTIRRDSLAPETNTVSLICSRRHENKHGVLDLLQKTNTASLTCSEKATTSLIRTKNKHCIIDSLSKQPVIDLPPKNKASLVRAKETQHRFPQQKNKHVTDLLQNTSTPLICSTNKARH